MKQMTCLPAHIYSYTSLSTTCGYTIFHFAFAVLTKLYTDLFVHTLKHFMHAIHLEMTLDTKRSGDLVRLRHK